jgi:hypothetical protein
MLFVPIVFLLLVAPVVMGESVERGSVWKSPATWVAVVVTIEVIAGLFLSSKRASPAVSVVAAVQEVVRRFDESAVVGSGSPGLKLKRRSDGGADGSAAVFEKRRGGQPRLYGAKLRCDAASGGATVTLSPQFEPSPTLKVGAVIAAFVLSLIAIPVAIEAFRWCLLGPCVRRSFHGVSEAEAAV